MRPGEAADYTRPPMRLPWLVFALAISLSSTLAAQSAPSPLPSPSVQSAPSAQSAEPTRSAPADLLTDLRDDGSLQKGLTDESAEVRWIAARGLARLAEAPAIAALAERAASESDEEVLAELVFALGQRGQADAPSCKPVLLALLGHESAAIRAAAVASLARLADDGTTDAVVALLTDPNASVRAAAALALFRLDGRRYDHARTADGDSLDHRDAALMNRVLSDEDAGVRWRAAYALAGVRGRDTLAGFLSVVVRRDEPLVQVFALRGLAALEDEQRIDLGSPGAPRLEPLLQAADERVVIEAARALARSGPLPGLAEPLVVTPHASAIVRFTLAEALRKRLQQADIDAASRAAWCETLQRVALEDASPMVRREVAALIVALAPPDHALFDLYLLAGSDDWRDRERAAKELAERTPALDAAPLLERLLHDVPAVAAAALPAPAPPDVRRARLIEALRASDAALVAAAAEESMKPTPSTDPQLVTALKAAHQRSVGPEMKEARSDLRKALGLPPDTAPPAQAPAAAQGSLLERLLAEHRAALADPAPKVELRTSQGLILLQLDRVNAPRHVASFLELAAAGFYDGLDFHRVVPDFVVQGLDPRGDGYGTGGRRLPDEFSPRGYAAGTLGMPNAGEPHTGGCQIFISNIPTPHLNGNYTVFGEVVSGMDVVQRIEIGDTVTRVRRIGP